MSLRRALDGVARWTIRSPWSAIGLAVVPALALAALLPATPVDLTFTGVMNRDNEHVGRYFEMSEQYELGGLLLVLLEGEEELLDDAVERTIRAAQGLPSVAAARRPLPLDWLEEQAPWLVERPLFDRWLGLAERPDDLANLAEFAASAVALRGAVGGVPGARLVEIKMATDPLAEEVGQSAFFELEAAVERALAGSGVAAGFSGLPALSAGDQEQTLGAIKRLTPISLVLVLLLFRIVEKRPGGMLSVAAVLVLSIGAALGAVGLLTGKLTVMETFFGVTVFGLGIDFAVHLFVRQREELAHGRPFEEALRRTVRGAGRGVVAGCITTAGAFLIAAAAPDPVALHLGLSGGLGLLFCLPLTLLILPSVWVLRERRSQRRSRPAAGVVGGRATPVRVPGLPSVVRWATERPVRCLAVSAVVLGAALAGLPRLQVETRLERIMNRGVPAIAMVDRIQEVLGTNGAPWILAAESLEQARDYAARLDGHPLFSETVSLGSILPAELAERAEALNRVFGPEGQTAAPAGRTGDPWALAVGALRRAAAAGPPSLDSLPPGLREKFIAPTGEFLVYAYATDSKADGALARRQREVVQAIDPGASGLLAVVEGMMIGARPWIPWIALSILGFVLLVLCVDFRRPASVLLAVLPVLAAVPFTLGALCWIGIPFNVMTWLVLPLIFGLGIDDGIHVVHRFLDDPAQPIRVAALSVGRAIAMTTLTTAASFSILLFTDHPGLETMAAVMLIGLPACLLASVTVLPAAAVLLLEDGSLRSPMPEPIALCFSGGKDSCLALRELRRAGRFDVVELVATVTEAFDRVSMHGVRRSLLREQADSIGLPLTEVVVPPEPSNVVYEREMGKAFGRLRERGIRRVGFGDLFLEDLREYRERQLAEADLLCEFPIWHTPTDELARTFIRDGFRAVTVCVNPAVLPVPFVGRAFDDAFLLDLPAEVDPCGENGEFHTFVSDGPIFDRAIEVEVGEVTERDGFGFCDLLPAGSPVAVEAAAG